MSIGFGAPHAAEHRTSVVDMLEKQVAEAAGAPRLLKQGKR